MDGEIKNNQTNTADYRLYFYFPLDNLPIQAGLENFCFVAAESPARLRVALAKQGKGLCRLLRWAFILKYRHNPRQSALTSFLPISL